jgi:hypothetical protein
VNLKVHLNLGLEDSSPINIVRGRPGKTLEIPNMENKKTHWGVLALITFIALLFSTLLLLPPIKAKARVSRIQAGNTINTIASSFITMPNTNAISTAIRNKK